MSKKSLAAVITASIVGLAGGGAGIVSLVNQPSPSTQVSPLPLKEGGASITPQAFCQQLQAACAEGELRGVWVTSAEVRDGQLVLRGIVDRDFQRARVENKARELLQQMPSLAEQCPKGPDANGLQTGAWKEKLKALQKSWAEAGAESDATKEEKRQRRRQTRLDDVYFVSPNKLIVTGVCLIPTGNVHGLVQEEVESWREAKNAAAEANTTLEIDTAQIKRFPNPVETIEAAAKQQGKPSKLHLDWAWFDGDGRLRLNGAVPSASARADFLALVGKQLAPKWETDKLIRPDAGWSAEGVRVLDVEALPRTLQAQFAKSDKNPLRNKTHLDGALFRRHPVYGLQLHFRGLCIVSPFELLGQDPKTPRQSDKELEEQLPRLLQAELENAVKSSLPDGSAFTVALPTAVTFKPRFLRELQEKIDRDKANLRGVLIRSVTFDERGVAVAQGAIGNKPATKMRVDSLITTMLGTPQPGTAPDENDVADPQPLEEQQLEEQTAEEQPSAETANEFESYENVLPALWKEMARDPRWRYIHIDNVTSESLADVGNTLKFTGVWLHNGIRPTAKEKEEFNKYFTARAKELAIPYFDKDSVPEKFAPLVLEEVESPLPRLREEVLSHKELEGFVFLEAFFAEDGRLQIRGYYKGKEDKEDKEQLSKVEALMKDPRVVSPPAFGKRLEKQQQPNLKELQPIDYSLLKLALQKLLAGRGDTPLGRTRIDDVIFRYIQDNKEPVLFGKGVCLQSEAEEIRKALQTALRDGSAAYLKKPFTAPLDIAGIVFKENPVPSLQAEVAADPRLDGVLFKAAHFNETGQLELRVLTDEERQSDVTNFLKKSRGEAAPKFDSPDWLPKGTKWSAVAKSIQTHLASEKNILLNQTRVDRLYFIYDGPASALRLHVKGVCINEEKGETESRTKLQEMLAGYLKSNYSSLLQTVDKDDPSPSRLVAKIEFKKLPLKALQDKIREARVRGAVITGAYYDANGTLQVKGSKPTSKEGQQRLHELLQAELKGTGIVSPTLAGPARPEPEKKAARQFENRTERGRSYILVRLAGRAEPPSVPPAFSTDELVPLDWDEILDDLRKQFAGTRSEQLFRQTRIDDAEFRYEDGDRKPHLQFETIALLPPGGAAANSHLLEKRLEQYFKERLLAKLPQFDFKVVLPSNEKLFLLDPTPGLQRLAATKTALDGVLFYAAWFDPERRLNLDTFLDKSAGHEALIKDLLAEDTIARRHVWDALLKNEPEREPRLRPLTNLAWQGQRHVLQREFADSHVPRLQKTRIDRLYFAYVGDDTGDRRLRAVGVCLAPGGAAKNSKPLATAIEEHWRPRLPAVKQFTVVAGGDIAFTPSPIIGLQQLAVARRLDSVLFDTATYDGEGVLHLSAYLTDPAGRTRVAELIGVELAREVLKPALGAGPKQDKPELETPRPFPWRREEGPPSSIAARLQAHFASSDSPAARQSRVDRAYFLYEKDEERRLHLEGVSLWTGRPAALPEKLTVDSQQVLPTPDYRVVAEGVVRRPNPAPALQERLTGDPRFDGVLFEDAGYDPRGRLLFPILVANAEQEKKVVELLKDPSLVEGVRPAAPAQRDIQRAVRFFDWSGMVKQVRTQAARQESGSDLRRTRLERAYFARPEGVCQLHFVGVSLAEPAEEAGGAMPVRVRVAKQLQQQCDKYLTPLNLQASTLKGVADKLELYERNLGPIVQRDVSTQRLLDGVYVKGAGFDATGAFVPEGVWIGAKQDEPLKTLVSAALGAQAERFTSSGFSWDGMRVLPSDELLRDLRKWVIEETKAEEVLLDRLFFNPSGLITIYGFLVPPGRDKAAVEKGLQGVLQKHPVGRPLLYGPPGETPVASDAAPTLPPERLYLHERTSVAAHLRGLVPEDTKLDGIRVDRFYYDLDGILVLTGLEDEAGQSRLLDPLLQAAQRSPDLRPQLARTWRYGTFTRVPLARMVNCLSRAMPADPIFDAVLLQRCYHSANGRLVLAGYTTGQTLRPEAEQLLLQLVAKEPAWAARLVGGPLPLFQKVTADAAQIEKAFWRAIDLFATADEEAAMKVLDMVLLHAPADPTLWYFRAICHLTLDDDVLAQRDLRRLMFLNEGRWAASYSSIGDSPLNVRKLERIQGDARTNANKILNRLALTPPTNRLLPEMLKTFCAEPTKRIRYRVSPCVSVYLRPCLCP